MASLPSPFQIQMREGRCCPEHGNLGRGEGMVIELIGLSLGMTTTLAVPSGHARRQLFDGGAPKNGSSSS
jgi:hypothetical protein